MADWRRTPVVLNQKADRWRVKSNPRPIGRTIQAMGAAAEPAGAQVLVVEVVLAVAAAGVALGVAAVRVVAAALEVEEEEAAASVVGEEAGAGVAPGARALATVFKSQRR
jgi:hypothetical protein